MNIGDQLQAEYDDMDRRIRERVEAEMRIHKQKMRMELYIKYVSGAAASGSNGIYCRDSVEKMLRHFDETFRGSK